MPSSRTRRWPSRSTICLRRWTPEPWGGGAVCVCGLRDGLDGHARRDHLTLAVRGHLARECDGLLGSDVGRGRANTEGEAPRLGDEAHAWIVESEPGRI